MSRDRLLRASRGFRVVVRVSFASLGARIESAGSSSLCYGF